MTLKKQRFIVLFALLMHTVFAQPSKNETISKDTFTRFFATRSFVLPTAIALEKGEGYYMPKLGIMIPFK